MISGRLAPFSTSSARLTASGAGICAGAGSMTLTSDLAPALASMTWREQLGRQVEIDAAGAARDGRADGACHADADVGGVQHAEGGLAQRLGDGELVHLLVVALLQIDDLALGRARDQDHREAVGGGVGERGEAVEEAGRRHREADAGLLRQEAGDRGRVAGVLLVAEGDDADACGLRHAAKVGDRDAGHAVDRIDAVELERVDDEMEAVRQLLLAGCVRIDALCCCGHLVASHQLFSICVRLWRFRAPWPPDGCSKPRRHLSPSPSLSSAANASRSLRRRDAQSSET